MGNKQRFVREKLADTVGDNYEIIEPTIEQKIELVKDKFLDKAENVGFIFDCEKMKNYYLNKANKDPDNADSYLKIVNIIDRDNYIPKFAQSRMLSRNLADLLQLENDLLHLLDIQKGMAYKSKSRFKCNRSFDSNNVCFELKQNALKMINPQIKDNSYLTACLINIHRLVEELAYNAKIDMDNLNNIRRHIKETEGDYYNGKIIVKIMIPGTNQ